MHSEVFYYFRVRKKKRFQFLIFRVHAVSFGTEYGILGTGISGFAGVRERRLFRVVDGGVAVARHRFDRRSSDS